MIGVAMLYTVLAGIPVTLAALWVASFLRRHGRPERGVWLLALGLALLLPVWMMMRPATPVSNAWAPVIELGMIAAELESPAGATVRAPSEAPAPLAPDDVLLGLWALASLVLAVRWRVSTVRLRRIGAAWRPAELDGVPLSLTSGFGPAVTGLFRPRVVVPLWVADLPEERRRLVLRHEVEHVRAGDQWLIGLRRLARVLTPWNPVVWVLTARLGQAVELDCDRRVLRRHPDVAAYGATLLAVSAGSRGLLAAAFAESDVPLRRRILAMTTPPRAFSAVGIVATVAVGAALVAGAAVVPAPAMQVVAAQVVEQGLPAPRVIGDPTRGPGGAVLIVRRVPGDGGSAPREMVWSPDGQRVRISPDGRWLALDYSIPTASLGVVPFDSGFVRIQIPPDRPPSDLTETPRILNPGEVTAAVGASYPAGLRERGIGGTVGVQFRLDQEGQVLQTRVGQISMYPALDEAALEVAEVYRFSPAMADDEGVPVWVAHAVSFRAP